MQWIRGRSRKERNRTEENKQNGKEEQKERKRKGGGRERKKEETRNSVDRFYTSLDNDEERISEMKDEPVTTQTAAHQNVKKR